MADLDLSAIKPIEGNLDLGAIQPAGSNDLDLSAIKAGDEPGSEANPIHSDIYGSALERVKGSFGNVSGITPLLAQKGFKAVKVDKSGDIIAQDSQGDWHKDISNFTHGGGGVMGLLPAHPINWLESHVGSALPFAGGVMGGAGEGVATLGGGAPMGAALGAAGGEAAREAIGRGLGVYEASPLESASDMGAEALKMGLGQKVGEVAGALASRAAPYLKSGVAKAGEVLSGGYLPAEALGRLMDRPEEVMQAAGKRFGFNLGQEASQAVSSQGKELGQAVGGAKEAFNRLHGDEPIDTGGMLESLGLPKKELYTKQDLEKMRPFEQRLLTPVQAEEGGEVAYFPKADARDLMRLSEDMDASYSGAPSEVKLRNAIKDQLHSMDENGLDKADQAFAAYKENVDPISGLQDGTKAESIIQNLFKSGNTAAQDALGKLNPQLLEKAQDLNAAQQLYGAHQDTLLSKILGFDPRGLSPTVPLIRGAIGQGAKAAQSDLAEGAVGSAFTQAAEPGTLKRLSQGYRVVPGMPSLAGGAHAEEPEDKSTPTYFKEYDQGSLQSMSEKAKMAGDEGMASILGEAARAHPQRRNALLFTLRQNAGYRQALAKYGEGIEPSTTPAGGSSAEGTGY